MYLYLFSCLGSVLDLATNSQSWVSTTNFISDRLRCVRQDIIVQQLPWQHAVPILERIIRYHIAVECLLMKESLSDYDPILNNVLLDSYMGDLFEYYDAAERENKTLKYSTEFVGYYILLNIQNASIFYKENISNYYHKNCNSRAELATTKLLVENFYKRNFYRFFKTVKELTFLQACCLIKSYNILRINFLKQLNVAFSNKSLKFPLEKIQEWMLFSSTEDARIFLNTCGFSVPVDVSFLYFDKNILVKDFSPVELIELNYTLSSQKFFQEKQLETKLLLHTINKNDEDYLS